VPQGKGFEVEHFHTSADEHFDIISGTLSYKIKGKTFKAHAEEQVILPKGQAHAH
jgi:mannose-6-phosphate isomerase-like protein (cupin superfamily)